MFIIAVSKIWKKKKEETILKAMRRLRNNQTQPSYFEAEKNKPRDSL